MGVLRRFANGGHVARRRAARAGVRPQSQGVREAAPRALGALAAVVGAPGPEERARIRELEAAKNAELAQGIYNGPASEAYWRTVGPYMMGAGTLGGQRALKGNQGALDEAMQMRSNRVGPSEIWEQTGWEHRPIPKREPVWRFEIPDVGTELKVGTRDYETLKRVFDHPELYANYPGLSGIALKWRDLDNGTRAQFEPSSFKVSPFDNPGSISLSNELRVNPMEARSSLLHELQHAIQKMEGTPRGANPRALPKDRIDTTAEGVPALLQQARALEKQIDDLSRKGDPADGPLVDQLVRRRQDIEQQIDRLARLSGYSKSAGEVEARLVQKRRNYGPYRRNRRPLQDEDTPLYRQWAD